LVESFSETGLLGFQVLGRVVDVDVVSAVVVLPVLGDSVELEVVRPFPEPLLVAAARVV
jgi:hypothetical protein